MVVDLDKNRDNQISTDEFELWWLSGRSGPTGAMSKVFGHAVNSYGKSIGGVWSEEAMAFAKASKADVIWDETKGQRAKLEFSFNGGHCKDHDNHCGMTLWSKVWLGGSDAYKQYGVLK
jgi:hypothetical protein